MKYLILGLLALSAMFLTAGDCIGDVDGDYPLAVQVGR